MFDILWLFYGLTSDLTFVNPERLCIISTVNPWLCRTTCSHCKYTTGHLALKENRHAAYPLRDCYTSYIWQLLHVCVCISNLHYGDVSMQHSEGEGCPVSTIRMHRGVLWGAWWNLTAQNKSVLHNEITFSRKHTHTQKNITYSSLCEFKWFKSDVLYPLWVDVEVYIMCNI